MTVDTNATSAEGLQEAMSKVATYARGQTADLVAATIVLKKAVDAGSVPQAKEAYAAGRPYYERIEPLVALFPELDGKIDAREDDFPKKGEDPDLDRLPPDRARALARRRDHGAHPRAGGRPGTRLAPARRS